MGFTELETVIEKKSYSTTRNLNDKTRIYAELLSNDMTVRVITVGDYVPNNCFIYDIDDIGKYKGILSKKCSNENAWIDEKKWWAEVIK